MEKTPHFSWKLGRLPKGCQLCVQGKKLVLFITGLCPRKCFYCPISDKKSQKDVIYANEWPIKETEMETILKEAELCGAKGAGITGGDPLVKLARTVTIIKNFKQRFGQHFHIHLYTSLNLITEETLKQLYYSGLDEIRVHPDLDDRTLWSKISLLKKFSWDVGVEIPLIPTKEKETKEVIDFIQTKIDFINLNELEISDTNANHLVEKHFLPKNSISHGVGGSEELGLRMLDYVEKKYPSLKVHYCTTTLKDRVQLAERIKRRAKNIKEIFDVVTEEGMLKRGAIYLPEINPQMTRETLKKIKQNERLVNQFLERLNILKEELLKKFKITNTKIDVQKLRILLSQKDVKKYAKEIKKMNLIPALVEEYPTYDGLEIEIEPI
ncbi:4Fe-4S cluster-binding domain-containing protein [Candidatus Woesearchaeota archaeon]|nr:4Fe-4S cluster-binding domain-containing protein [Candidatus Woesearchaeota archaeon]HLC77698.1 radical SAM protein [Candidatus Nanoarchaeia archaeon]